MKQIKFFPYHADIQELESEVNRFCNNHSGIICDIHFHVSVEGGYGFYYASVVYA